MKFWLRNKTARTRGFQFKPMTSESILSMRMSTTEAPTGEYSHPASGIWTLTKLCTRHLGEGVVETFDTEIGQSEQVSVLHSYTNRSGVEALRR
ncbi:hypothetical protein ARMSODRAFT_966576 [Armillaria solidipes]|uniref:Uncharacterized protein n=1 Tax=Armillaria solidipes TaxID=1076256 RepID=A0A2H3AQ42_9AGAR|nr:hypothetical protein ARMSODRAFT_966576 [Armillaria solidipes]